ncbi:MAG: hypothetical protein KDD60_11190, partial [Bdellovibrionales bacterium]|nr:hypothetical protein [Bdellovibrionales bacterium]
DFSQAVNFYRKVPVDHERTSEAIRGLSEIAFVQGHSEQVEFWLQRGRKDYPSKFLDSWVDYALARVALQTGDSKKAWKIRHEAENRYPPSDPWLTLLQASLESFEWKGTSRKR